MHDLRTGSVLQGRYELVSTLGAGGFGAVYKAIQLATKQPVAVKVMHPIAHEADDRRTTRAARFRREMELCARLQHPNIVGLVDSGQTDDGRLFVVFQLASGQTLDQVLIDEGALRPREAHYLMSQVLDALSCAHNLGVVHRDLKPANIMLVATGTRRNAMVLDFGIGTMADDLRDPAYTKLTAQHEWVGTPHYTAPEHIRGEPATSQSDIYSWGLVFLECLTGRRAIEGSSTDALLFHVSPTPVAIPASLRHHRLGRLLDRAVVKDVAARTATAANLLAELDRCDISDLDHLAVGGNAASPAPRKQVLETAPTRGLASLATQHTTRVAPDRLVEGERRQITAVCCSLAPEAELELDELELLIHAQQEICADAAHRFRGQLAGGLGHQVLIEFGYPTASEDDAVRAARAALAIRAAVAERNAKQKTPYPIAVRIGLHTGLIAYSQTDSERRSAGQNVGMTPMIASQISGRAATGAIVASAATASALRAHIVMTSLGNHVIDGTGRGIELFQLESARPAPTTQDTHSAEAALPLIGRDREIAHLLDRWHSVSHGTGQSVLITGETGIGKSRLAVELHQRIGTHGHSWLEARATLETRNRVLHPIIEVLERVLDLVDAPPATRLARLEAALTALGFRPADVVPLFASLLAVPTADPAAELPPNRARELTLNAIVSLLLELSERAPVILFIEDLHWADPTTLELLGALIAAVPTSRMLILLCARPEFTPPWPSTATHQIQLTRLVRSQIEQLVQLHTGGKPLPASVVEQMVARTDGVPLFVEELTRMVIESGALTLRGDHYELTGTLSDVAIPTTLRALLMSKLDRLGRAKQTAQLAAALGREFDLALLTAVASVDAATVQDDLQKLTEADLVHHKRRLTNPTWLFRHALIRDTAYESMPRRAQHKVHARIAEVIERQFPEIASARPDLLAMHHAAAEQKLQAIRYAHKAALAALMGSAFSHALRHAREALGWLDGIRDPQARVDAELDLRVTQSVPLMMTLGFASKDVETNFLRVLELCELAGERAVARQFPALCGLWTFRVVSGDHAGAEEAAARLTALAQRTAEASIRLAALTAHGTAVMMQGRLAEARRAFEDALAIYDRSAHAGIAIVLGQDAGAMCASFLTWVHGHAGDLAAGEARAAEALALCDALNQPSTRAFVETVIATWRCLRGDFVDADRHASVVTRLSIEQGMLHWAAQAQIIRGWATAGLGRPADGAALARAGIDALMGIGSRAAMTFYWTGLAEAELAAGHADRATDALDEANRYLAASGERIHHAGLALLEAKIAAATGQRDAAAGAIARALAIAEQQGAGEMARLAREQQIQLAST